ncbi:MAG: ribonuclease HII [Methylotetracoccus sp.]
MTSVGGIDEAGRGALAGPVIAAVVVLDPAAPLVDGLNDSKRLTPRRRAELARVIRGRAADWSLGRADASEIDRLNILQATMLAMRRAYAGLDRPLSWMQVDGNRYPDIACPGEAVIGGDAIEPAIMAASILAKVARDEEMVLLDLLHPGYEFAVNKGYPTADHRQSLAKFGSCAAHRRTFGPVRMCLDGSG